MLGHAGISNIEKFFKFEVTDLRHRKNLLRRGCTTSD